MAANEPTSKNLADLYELPPLDWDDVRRTLETQLTHEFTPEDVYAVGSKEPGGATRWTF